MVSDINEVLINGTALPIMGIPGFRRQLITPFPPKLVIGDVNKDDEPYISTFIQNDALGGFGLLRVLDRSQTERDYISWLNTSYRSGITLPEYVANYGAPDGVTGTNPNFAVDFLGHVWVAWSDKLYQLNDSPTDGATGNTNWTASVYTAAAAITGLVVYRGYLYVSSATSTFTTPDGAAFTVDGGASTGGADFLVLHDDKVWRFKTNVIYQQATFGGTWATNPATFTDTRYSVKNLISYIAASGDPALHLSTTGGLYVLDETVTPPIWKLTNVEYTPQANAGRGLEKWRGDLYVSAGLDMYRYTSFSTGTVDASLGISKDDGPPLEMDGSIIDFAHALNDLYALVDQSQGTVTTHPLATARVALPFSLQNPAHFDIHADNGVYVTRFNGTGWSILWQSPPIPSTITTGGLFVSGSPTPRIFWPWNGSYYACQLPKGIRNPWQNTTVTYQAGPKEHITPWFQGLAESLNKIGVSIKLFCKNMSSTETISCYFAANFEDAWRPFPNDSSPDNIISLDGQTTLPLGDSTYGVPLGKPYQAIRFKFVFNRGTDSSKSPTLMYWIHYYTKILPTRWGFSITANLKEDYKGNTPKNLIQTILNAIDNEELVTLQFHDTNVPDQTAYAVMVSHCQSREMVGVDDFRGIWDISFIEPGGL